MRRLHSSNSNPISNAARQKEGRKTSLCRQIILPRLFINPPSSALLHVNQIKMLSQNNNGNPFQTNGNPLDSVSIVYMMRYG